MRATVQGYHREIPAATDVPDGHTLGESGCPSAGRGINLLNLLEIPVETKRAVLVVCYIHSVGIEMADGIEEVGSLEIRSDRRRNQITI